MSNDYLPDGAERLPPPTLSERHEINELMRVVRSYTHLVAFKNNTYFGTAVVLRHDKRLFAFTAAHNIAEDTAVHFRMCSSSDQTQFSILGTYIHPDYDRNADVSSFDLAILELQPSNAISAGNIDQLPKSVAYTSNNSIHHDLVSNSFVWVVGYPVELASLSPGKVVLKQTAFCTQIMECSSDQISLNFPTTEYQMPQDGTTCEIGKMTATPKGYSGGGVWVVTNPSGELFDPHRHIKLVGIQTHFSSTKRRLRCVTSKVMLESFRQFRPGLLES